MFGYVVINKPEMKFRDFDVYRSFYCGLCRKLKERHGLRGQVTLSYDLTFLVILLSGLYEDELRIGKCRCMAHPLERHMTRINEFSEYAADMNVILAYFKCLDDWEDDRKLKKKAMSSLLRKPFRRVSAKYPEKTALIKKCLTELSEYEKKDCRDIDAVSGCFGRLMAELFCYRKDEWEQRLSRMGFFLGKYVYILDAYNDVHEDISKGRYNPLKDMYNNKNMVHNVLIMMAAECAKEFEALPIIEYTDILRNILYAGIWSRYDEQGLKPV